MRKVTILASSRDIESSLKNLRRAGVVHIKHVQKTRGERILRLEKKLEDITKAISLIPEIDKQDKLEDEEKITSYIHQINSLTKEEQKLSQEKERLEKEIDRFKNWGEFNPYSISELKENGIFIKLYTCSMKKLAELPSDKTIQVINHTKKEAYIALVTTDENEQLGFPEVTLPEKPLSSLKKELIQIQARIKQITQRKFGLAKYKNAFLTYKRRVQKELEFYQVKSGMGKEEGFSYILGFCPKKSLPALKSLANKQNWALLSQLPDDPAEVPTLIKNPPWIEIIKPVFKFMGTLPGYNEYDVSIWFLVFLSLFFAMLVGDAGYGIFFLLATFFLYRKFSQLQQKKEAVFLMYVFSGVTIIWGTITGTWFGVEKVAQLPFLNYFVIDRINSFVSSNQGFLMYICFLLGVIHLSIGHAIVGFRYINSLFALSQLGWISILWGLFFIIRKLIIGISLPGFTLSLLIMGVLLVIFFSSPQRNILKGIAKGIGKIPLKTINSFSDIVSYVRLFAVGYATVAVASSFNNMALSIGVGNILKGFIAALVLFLGHSLNILLALMAVIVHGIRLNMLEFSSHAGIEWKGYEYRPFSDEDTTYGVRSHA